MIAKSNVLYFLIYYCTFRDFMFNYMYVQTYSDAEHGELQFVGVGDSVELFYEYARSSSNACHEVFVDRRKS